jgi:hypothetical protein
MERLNKTKLAKMHTYLKQHLLEYAGTLHYVGTEFDTDEDGEDSEIYLCKCGRRFAYKDQAGWHDFANAREEFVSMAMMVLPKEYRKLFVAYCNRKGTDTAWQIVDNEKLHKKTYAEDKIFYEDD